MSVAFGDTTSSLHQRSPSNVKPVRFFFSQLDHLVHPSRVCLSVCQCVCPSHQSPLFLIGGPSACLPVQTVCPSVCQMPVHASLSSSSRSVCVSSYQRDVVWLFVISLFTLCICERYQNVFLTESQFLLILYIFFTLWVLGKTGWPTWNIKFIKCLVGTWCFLHEIRWSFKNYQEDVDLFNCTEKAVCCIWGNISCYKRLYFLYNN